MINDLMKFLKQDEKLVNLPGLLVACTSDNKAMTALVECGTTCMY